MLAVHLFGRPLAWASCRGRPAGGRAARGRGGGARARGGRGGRAAASGVMGCFSFHPRKIVTTGEGGAVTTSDEALADAIRRMRNHGMEPLADFDIRSPG